MADRNREEFEARLQRIGQARSQAAPAASAGLLSRARRRGMVGLKVTVLVAAAVIGLKGVMIAYIGSEDYGKHLDALASGSSLDQVSAAMMGQDPLASTVSTVVSSAAAALADAGLSLASGGTEGADGQQGARQGFVAGRHGETTPHGPMFIGTAILMAPTSLGRRDNVPFSVSPDGFAGSAGNFIPARVPSDPNAAAKFASGRPAGRAIANPSPVLPDEQAGFQTVPDAGSTVIDPVASSAGPTVTTPVVSSARTEGHRSGRQQRRTDGHRSGGQQRHSDVHQSSGHQRRDRGNALENDGTFCARAFGDGGAPDGASSLFANCLFPRHRPDRSSWTCPGGCCGPDGERTLTFVALRQTV